MKHSLLAWTAGPLIACALAACQSTPKLFDYGPYLGHMPTSILVLPPLDQSPAVDATYEYLSTVTEPLAERGYYVFPVAMVAQMLRENGLPTPGEMHEVSLTKLGEVFGADAVLFVTITDWGTSYQVLESRTTVRIVARLVDVKSGLEIWHGEQSATASSNDNNQGGLAGMLVGAVMNQIVTSVDDPSTSLATQANTALFDDNHVGLLEGRYSPNFEKDQEARRAAATPN